MSVSLKRTMLAFGLLLLCLSAAVTGYEPGPSFKFEVRVKTLRKRMLLKSIQGRSGKPYAKPKASSSQRHHLHQQHRWDLRVQANGKNDEKNQHDVVFKYCDIDLIESNLVEDDIDLAKYPMTHGHYCWHWFLFQGEPGGHLHPLLGWHALQTQRSLLCRRQQVGFFSRWF